MRQYFTSKYFCKAPIALLLILQGFSGQAQLQDNDIYFRLFLPEEQLPFNTEDQARIASNKIVSGDIHSGTKNVVYFFDSTGKVSRYEVFFKNKKKKNLVLKQFYKYDASGRIVLVTGEGLEPASYDSLVYDAAGRMTYFLSETIYTDRFGKKQRQRGFELQLKAFSGEQTILADERGTTYALNRYNELLQKEGPSVTVKILTDSTGAGARKKTFWLKSYPDSTFRLHQEEFYTNEKLNLRRRYNQGREHSVDSLTYNDKGLLKSVTERFRNYERVIERNEYSPEGLLLKRTTTSSHGEITEEWTYTYAGERRPEK